jgi:hypothetical protein
MFLFFRLFKDIYVTAYVLDFMLEGISKNLTSLHWLEVDEENYENNNRNNWLSDMELKRDVPNAREPLLSVINSNFHYTALFLIWIAMATAAFKNMKALFTSKLDLNLGKKLVK